MKDKLCKWIIYSIIFSLTPIIYHFVRLLSREKEISFATLLGRGEILLICAVISAAAVGEIIASGKNWKTHKLISGGGCLLILVLSSAWFADVSIALNNKSEYISLDNVATGSLIMFIFAISASLSCVVLSELD